MPTAILRLGEQAAVVVNDDFSIGLSMNVIEKSSITPAYLSPSTIDANMVEIKPPRIAPVKAHSATIETLPMDLIAKRLNRRSEPLTRSQWPVCMEDSMSFVVRTDSRPN